MKSALIILASLLAASVSAFGKGPGGRPPPRDHAAVVAEMIGDYDLNEDDALDSAELEAAFKGIREARQAERRKQRKFDGEGRPGKRGGPPPRPEPSELIGEFDVNETGTLDAAELLSALDDMRAKRMAAKEQRRQERSE